MRKFLNFAVLFAVFMVVFSCRKSGAVPEDTHEHEEISRVILKLTKISDGTSQTVICTDGVASAGLILDNGESYEAELSFLAKHGNHYHEVNSEIIKEKDEHFISFEFAGIDMLLGRSAQGDVRTDGNIVGLKSSWVVGSAPATDAKVGIKLYHQPKNVKQDSPSVAQQFGAVTGGSVDVDIKIDIK